MEIEVWKRYRTRGGRKVGPMRSDASFGEPAFIEAEGDGRGWSLSGRAIGVEHGADEDLIAEWTDGPAFTVGAKVRVTSDAYGKEQLGKTGRVVEVGRSGSLDIEIEYDEPLIHANGLKRNQYRSDDLELIPDGPVRTVTRTVTEIVPGVYGIVKVGPRINGLLTVELSSSTTGFTRSVGELKAAAAVLLELAGALDA